MRVRSVSRRVALLVFVMAGVIGTSFAAGATGLIRSATDTPLDATETITQSAVGLAVVKITEERSDRPDAAICVEAPNGQACTVRSATEPMLYSGTDGQGGILLVVVDPQRRLDGVDIADAGGTRRVLSLDGGLSVIATAVGAARSASAIGQEGEVLATFDTGRLEMHRAQAQDAVDEQPDH